MAASQAFKKVYSRFDSFNYYQSLLISLDSLASLHQITGFTDRYNYYSFKCGYYHIAKQDEANALLYADSLLVLVNTGKEESGNSYIRQAMANLSKGDLLFSAKRYNEALPYLYQSKVAAEKSNDADTKSRLYYCLAMVRFRQAEYEQAAHYFVLAYGESADSLPGFSKFYRTQEVLNNIAESYVMAKKPDSALLYYPKAQQYLTRHEALFNGKDRLVEIARAVMDGTAAQAYLLQKDTAQGMRLLNRSIAVNSKPGYDKGNAIQMQLSLAGYYLDNKLGKAGLEKARITLTDIGRELDSFRNEEYRAQWNRLFSRYYDESGDYEASLRSLKRAVEYDSKKEDDNRELSSTDVSAYFTAMQNQYEMKLLKKNSDVERTYLVIAIVLFLLCSIIILLIWRYWNQSQRHVTILEKLNRKIQRQKKELERTLEALHRQSEEKDHILKVIAHDLRNPVSAINALSRLIKSDPTLDAEQADCLNLINTASIESLDLIESIMQMEDNHMRKMQRQMHNVNEVMMKCISQVKPSATAKGQSLVVELPEEQQIAFIDTDKIQRVIKNLLVNAIKFSHKGSAIHVSVKSVKKNIVIAVKDHGIGIPDSLHTIVFDTFTQAKRRGTENEKTFGLGLSICKQFVEAHGGKIWFTSEENQGTCFYVKLPKRESVQSVPEVKVLMYQ